MSGFVYAVAYIAIAAIGARLLKIPYVVGLVVAGVAIGMSGHPVAIAFTPRLVMLFFPPLLFAGAWEMDLTLLRRRWVPISLLATVGVAIGIAATYVLLAFGAHIDGRVALVFGVVVAATDPVAVIALLRDLKVDRSLATIVEGESIFNDGVAVVAFQTIALGIAGGAGAIAFHPVDAALSFGEMTAGGALVGIATGMMAPLLLRPATNWLLEILITVVVAYGSYILAESLHLSGLVAVIVSGLSCSVIRSSAPPQVTQAVDRFWEFAAFIANCALFILVGLAIDVRSLAAFGQQISWAVLAVVVARMVTIYGLAPLSAAAGSPVPRSWQHIVALAGLRGALSMALVLSLPEDFQYRGQLIAMVYAVVLFTLIVAGISLRPALNALLPGQRERFG